MKKLRFFLSIQLALGLLISVPSLAATQLDVTGKGMVSVAPDEATITAQVSLIDSDAGKAQALASKEVDAMLSAIKPFSLKPDSLNASELSLLPEYRWDRATDQQQFIGFRVTRTISFTIAEIDRLGAALSALANAGATLISSPVMRSSQAQDARDKALVKAVEDARKKLTLLAGAADMSLTRISQISEIAPHSTRPQPTLMRAEMALDSASSSTFVAGNLTFVAEVRAQAEAE
ncbi:MAG: SIMPL domain-containing protein [Pseudomonadota bacterium]|nr:SIMPL domain-containing protein [Pseudomonadota bacterium]